MANYSQENLAAMQEDALNRVREMQRRARQKIEQDQFNSNEPPIVTKNAEKYKKSTMSFDNALSKEKNKKYEDKKVPHTLNGPFKEDMFSSLIKKIIPNMDSDRIFLLILMLMLKGQKTDNELMLALFYIMT